MGKSVFANKIVFPIWLDFNMELKFKKKDFYFDQELREVAINWITGAKVDNPNFSNSVTILK